MQFKTGLGRRKNKVQNVYSAFIEGKESLHAPQ